MSATGDRARRRAFWDRVAPRYERFTGWSGWTRVVEAVAEGATGRVLDAGCGPGRLVDRLAVAGAWAVGVDSAPGMLREARRLGRAGTFVLAEVTTLPFRDAAFDVVLSTGTLGLLRGRAQQVALGELARVCRGEVRLLEPVEGPGRGLLARLGERIFDGQHPIPTSAFDALGVAPSIGRRTHLGVFAAIRFRPGVGGHPAPLA